MPKMSFIKEIDENNRFDSSRIQVDSIAEGLPEIVEDFVSFLRASGFYFHDLEIIFKEETSSKQEEE